ncbi:lipopolysaccharide export system permease protein [Orbus hercynius]|uniref:Lipopolysaccharide export system permease protein n=1 Tax=Orbus hercynius TaxID=593135 RepID=A0A495RJL4_9GAMM|nr:LPS export ABC transporter permease LptG [Orbus hercynius]RKS87521.1 lipopolysaccharide export system permease protein [Orbus hercynius]
MFSILDRYIGKTILSMISLSLFLLISLSGIIRFIDQLRRVKGDYDALSAALYSLLMVPKDLEVFFPIAALLGSLIGLGMLASKSELVVMQTSGFSRLHIIKAVLKTAIPLVLIVMAIGEWVAPWGEQTARNMRSEKAYGDALIATQNSIWAKDGNDYIHIGKVDSTDTIADLDILSVNNGELTHITHAAYANYKNNSWQLFDVEKTDLTDPYKVNGVNLFNMPWQTTITPDKLNIVAQDPESLSASGLYQYAKYLKSSGLDPSNYELLFWKKLLKPLSVAVMMLLALSFIFGPLRSVSMGIRVITGIFGGFIFFIADSLFSKLSIVIGIPPVLGAALTSVAFLGLSYYLFKRKS